MKRITVFCMLSVTSTLSLLACGNSAEFSGVFHSTDPISLNPGPSHVYVELILAQYGPEVGGLVKLYKDETLTEPLDSGKCWCTPIVEGRDVDGELSFAAVFPATCTSTTGIASLKVRDLHWKDRWLYGAIEFKLCNENGESSSLTVRDWKAEQLKSLELTSMEDRRCP